MPLIDVRCQNDHIHEVMRPLAMYPNTPPCETCGEPTVQIHLPPQTTWSIDPVVVYRAADGSFRFPGDGNSLSTRNYDRQGYERIELRSAADVRRFQSSMNKREYAIAERRVERMQALTAARTSQSRSELRMRMQSMSEFGKAVARAAMDRNDAKPGMRAHDPGFHLEAFEYNRSNREESRDAQGRRRRD